MAQPTARALNRLILLGSDAKNFFVDKHRPSVQIGAERAKKTRVQRVRVPTELPFLRATVAGWD